MRSAVAVAVATTVGLAALASACSRRAANADALQTNADAGTLSDAPAESNGDHAIDADSSERAPDAAQNDATQSNRFTSWTSCGWSSSETCLCEGIRACEAVAGGAFSALGSKQARVCAIDGDVCEFVVFAETEGGGKARRCRVPIGAGACTGGFADATDDQCVDLFTCNLLMGTCPPDIMPGTSVISCR